MILVRLNDKYVAPLNEDSEKGIKSGLDLVYCSDIGCQYIDSINCEDCVFRNAKILEDVEVKFKFIEEEN